MRFEYAQRLCSLDGRKAIVTGAGSGIGRATAEALAGLGAHVTLVGRRADNIREAADKIAVAGDLAQWRVADQSSAEQIDALFAWYEQTHGIPDIFVANAGINLQKTALETDVAEARGIIGNNYIGTLLCLQGAARLMKRQRSGSITVVTSINAQQPVYTEGLYSSIKAGLESLVRSAAIELSPYGVRVNAMAPGATVTGMSDLPLHPEKHERFGRAIPLGHVAAPEEMGEVIALMHTDAFRYMTGATVTVDGGLLLRKSVF